MTFRVSKLASLENNDFKHHTRIWILTCSQSTLNFTRCLVKGSKFTTLKNKDNKPFKIRDILFQSTKQGSIVRLQTNVGGGGLEGLMFV